MFPEEGSPLSLSYCLPGGSGRSGSLIHPRVAINGRVFHFYFGGHAMSCGRRKSGPDERVGERRLPQTGLSFTSKDVETNEMKGRYTPSLLPRFVSVSPRAVRRKEYQLIEALFTECAQTSGQCGQCLRSTAGRTCDRWQHSWVS